MFVFLYKYPYNFYLSSELFEDILKINNEITVKSIASFFYSNTFFINKKQINVKKISEFLFLICIRFRKEEELIVFKKNIKNHRELFPPWKVFPNLFYGSPRWNQGYQEDYCIKHWIPFWKHLNHTEKANYMLKYACPMEWKEWLNTYGNLF